MRFDFTFPVEVCGMHLFDLEGWAIITRCLVEPDNWSLDAIWIHDGGLQCEREEKKLACGHHLHTVVSMFLLQTKRAQIDDAWSAYLIEQRAEKEPA